MSYGEWCIEHGCTINHAAQGKHFAAVLVAVLVLMVMPQAPLFCLKGNILGYRQITTKLTQLTQKLTLQAR